MKTKHLKILSFLAIIFAFSCSTDQLQEDILQETEVVDKNVETGELSKGDNEPNSATSNQAKSSNGLPTSTMNSTTPLPGGGNATYNLYLNMDLIENDYNSDPNNPSYTGPFNVHYYNLMSNHFSIYHVIQSTNDNCGNVERWIVDLVEFNQYLVSIGLPEVDPDDNDWYDWLNDGNSNGGDTTNDTTHNVNGTAQRKKGIPPPPPPPNTPSWLINYSYCFTM
ncbi:hypothetical protein [Winogradskyella sp. PE311]|uniref:hypothetical protein n=1 Tax=Winogradskyella sp. PE311 TaxID=3366943 RepID=UPI003980AC05